MSTALVPVDDLVSLVEKLAPSTLLPEKLRGKPQDVLAIVMAGRELGLAPWASIRSLDVIDGKAVLNADGMAAVVRGSGKCDFLNLVESNDKVARWETQRKGGKRQELAFSIEEAKLAGLLKKDNWLRYPAAMLRARAKSALLKMVYEDVLAGVYSDDEAADFARVPAVTPAAVVIEPEIEVDELDWQLRVSAATSVDQLREFRIDFDALPNGAAKARIGDLISKRRSELARAYAAEMGAK